MSKWKNFMNENQFSVVTFDYDGTLIKKKFIDQSPYSSYYDVQPNEEMVLRLKTFKENGKKVYIVTRRIESRDSIKEIETFIKNNRISIDGLYFTNDEDKVYTLLQLHSNLHHDDDPLEIEAIKEYGPNIKTVLVKD